MIVWHGYWFLRLVFLGIQKTPPRKQKVQEIQISSDEEEESPPVPLQRRRLKKPVPAVETRPKIRIKTIAGRPPPVVINEPTEQEVIARLNNPSESDNSSPGAEIPVQVFASTDHHLFLDSLFCFMRILKETNFFYFLGHCWHFQTNSYSCRGLCHHLK